MICARCNHDSKSKDRIDGRCPACKGQFAFKQGRSDPISDKTFANAIAAVSANGELRWGVEHLHYEVTRRMARGFDSLKRWFVLFVVSLIAWLWMKWAMFAAAAILCGGMTIYAFTRRGAKHPPSPQFNDLWRRWIATHGLPAGVIQRREPTQPEEARPAKEADLELYSFDRAVICDRARTVDLLLANNFHFENNCAVISIDGYPRGAFTAVRAMLKRNPRLQIFALHDCTPAGCGLAALLADEPEWFRGQNVVDVGLRPVHVRHFPNLLPARRAVQATLAITPAERKWLGRFNAELAVLRPEQVLKRLYRAMSQRPEDDSGVEYGSSSDSSSGSDSRRLHENGPAESGPPGRVINDTDSFAVDAEASDGGPDGFG